MSVRFELVDFCKPQNVDAEFEPYGSYTKVTTAVPHNHTVGDIVDFTLTGANSVGVYEVVNVLDPYCIVINIGSLTTTGTFSVPNILEASPLGYDKTSYVTEFFEDNLFYRTTLNGRLQFTGKDYEWLKDKTSGCCQVNLRVYDCGGIKYKGLIDRNGLWDDCNCTFDAEVRPLDKYECLLSDEKINWLSCGDSVSAGWIWDVNWEFITIDNVTVLPPNEFPNITSGIGSQWSPIFAMPLTNATNTNNTTLLGREFTYRPCCDVDGAIRLNNAGWTQTGSCINGFQKFTRPLSESTGESGRDLVVLVSDFVTFSNSCTQPANTWLAYDNSGSGQTFSGCWYIDNAFFQNNNTFYNGRRFSEILDCYLCGRIKSVHSDFFEINPIGDAPGYVAGINYVTGQPNVLADLLIFATSSIAERFDNFGNTNIPTIGLASEKTFQEMMDQLKSQFDVYWFIDEQCRLRIEHRCYFEDNIIVDLSAKCLTYQYDNERKKKEVFEFNQASETDWTDKTIEYKRDCLQGEIGVQADCTINDIIHIRYNAEELRDSDAITFMVAQDFNGGLFQVLQEQAQYSGLTLPNAHLSWSNLIPNYHRKNRAFEYGCVNGCEVQFESSKERETELSCEGCCLDIPIRAAQALTKLGTANIISITELNGRNVYQYKLKV